jgi:hypothetical protein
MIRASLEPLAAPACRGSTLPVYEATKAGILALTQNIAITYRGARHTRERHLPG